MAPSISIAVDRRAGRHPRTSGAARRVYAWLLARWRRLAARRDAGGATVEAMFATILLLTVVMFAIQAAVAWHATHIAQAAATRAATAAAGFQSSASAGDTAGRQTLAALGNGVLKNPTVSVTRTATQVRVHIVGTAETVVPGTRWRVEATVVRWVERFVPDSAARTAMK
jgi:Flp pilus assembly protein TadG